MARQADTKEARSRRAAAFAGVATLLAGLLAATTSLAAAPPPTVSVLNPRSGTPTTPAPVSPALGTNGFRVQVQVWNDVADVDAVEVGWCAASADPDAPSSWSWTVAGAPNASYACGAGCAVHDLTLTQLPPGDYRLAARATSAADGVGQSSDGRAGDARWVHVRILQPGVGTGTLLVRDSSSRLCMDCHPAMSHSSQGGDGRYGNWATVCTDCHTPHGTPNLALVRPRILAPDGVQRDVTLHALAGDGPAGTVDSAAGAATQAVCQVCHTRTQGPGGAPRWRRSGNADADHYQVGGAEGARACGTCHPHQGGFSHGGQDRTCASCHGHDPGWGGSATAGAGTARSHSTHTEDDVDDLRGPNVGCEACHDLARMPAFASGTDADGDGSYSLAETDVCDGCHSPGGAVDGIADPAVGAKPNWASGVYVDGGLAPGKERWCAGCHDGGASVIPVLGGRQAPDVAGDGATWGYYVNGHGAARRECAACHDGAGSHNFDGRRTYAAALGNYVTAMRLAPVDLGLPSGPVPAMVVPRNHSGCAPFVREEFALCLSCHDEARLFGDVRATGLFDCGSNPYLGAAATPTGFRNRVPGEDGYGDFGPAYYPQNLHADHLLSLSFAGVSGGMGWMSMGPGVGATTWGDSSYSCSTCHDPHGARSVLGGPAAKMTLGTLAVFHGADAKGTYGGLGSTSYQAQTDPSRGTCAFACHGPGERWYQELIPAIAAIAIADADPADPAPADAGYANAPAVSVSLQVVNAAATEMSFAQDAAFTDNPTPWSPFAPAANYTLTPGDGPRAVYARVRSAAGSSAPAGATIVLDTVPPAFGAGGLTSPAGGEAWDQGATEPITWAVTSDANPRPGPISLALSVDGGATYPATLAEGEPDDGRFAWTIPAVETGAARVRATARDRAGNQRAVASGSDFTIRKSPPVVTSLMVADADPADPAPPEPGFTNAPGVRVEIAATGYPGEMELAEDPAFTVNATGWRPFAATSTYLLTPADGPKTVHVRVRSAAGVSAAASAGITLDATPPAIAAGTLTAPVGGERWTRGSVRSVTWIPGQVTDAHLSASPISLHYSADAGATWPTTLASAEANDGVWSWTLPTALGWRARVRLAAADRAGNLAHQASGADFAIVPPYVVTNTANSGPGSLRQAVLDLAAAGGSDTIWFDVPAASLTDGVAVVTLASPTITVAATGIVIDATSQAGLRGETNPRGPEVRLHGWSTASSAANAAFTVTGADATIRGFQLTGFNAAIQVAGARATVAGNHFCFRSGAATPYTATPTGLALVAQVTASQLTFGGGDPAARNHVAGCAGDAVQQASGVRLLGDAGGTYQGHAVAGNSFGLLPDGQPLANGTQAIVYDSSHWGSVKGNALSGSTTGLWLAGAGTTVLANTFGVRWTGSAWQAAGAQATAIRSAGAWVHRIGGGAVATGDGALRDSNVLASAPGGTAIDVAGDHDVVVDGNFIGTNPGRTERFGLGVGVRLGGATPGGTEIGAGLYGTTGNVIANATAGGVIVGPSAQWVLVNGNSFEGNGASAAGSDDAIRLEPGANGGIARPVVTAATASLVTVSGLQPGDLVEVYLSDYDGSGSEYGEGRRRVARAWASGASLQVDVSAAGLLPGQWVTALRTEVVEIPPVDEYEDPTYAYRTSAFSANVQVQ